MTKVKPSAMSAATSAAIRLKILNAGKITTLSIDGETTQTGTPSVETPAPLVHNTLSSLTLKDSETTVDTYFMRDIISPDKIESDGKLVLRSFDANTKDNYNALTGALLRKTREFVFDGRNAWFALSGQNANTAYFIYSLPITAVPGVGKCDKFQHKVQAVTTDEEFIRVASATEVYFVINKSRLSEVSTSGLIAWLATNPVKLLVKLATPVTYGVGGLPNQDVYVKHSDSSVVADTGITITYTESQVDDADVRKSIRAANRIARIQTNPLYGKIISLDGDSIAAGYGYTGGYGKIIADRNNMTYENLSVGGASVAIGTTAPHFLSTSIASMRADADYAIIEGGINDSAYIVAGTLTVGTLSADYVSVLDTTVFATAFEAMLKALVTRYRDKKYGYVFIHNSKADDHVWNTGMRPLMFQALAKWGVPYLDLQTLLPPIGRVESWNLAYTIDGIHPNEKFYREMYAPKIESWMKTL